MKILREISLGIGLALLVSSAAYAGTTLPGVTDPKPAAVQPGQSNSAILALPNNATNSKKQTAQPLGSSNTSAASGASERGAQLIPIPQPSQARQ